MGVTEGHTMEQYLLIGPFTQLLTMEGLPLKGPLKDSDIPILTGAGLLLKGGTIVKAGPYHQLREEAKTYRAVEIKITEPSVGLPGFIDSHTHSCFAGSRSRDYALRNSGSSYLEIANAGGGIWDSVKQTRQATSEILEDLLLERAGRFLNSGITTLEVKSGYGLSIGPAYGRPLQPP